MKTSSDGRNDALKDSSYLRWLIEFICCRGLLCFVCNAALIGCSSSQPSSSQPPSPELTEKKIAEERLAVERERAALERQRLALEQQQAETRKQAAAAAEKQKKAEERSRFIDVTALKVAALAVEMERKMVSASNRASRTLGGRSDDTVASGLHKDVFQEVRVRIISDTQGIGDAEFQAAVQRSVSAWAEEYSQRQVQKRLFGP